ncbi:MAG TPA: septal ring lytic transglycosylase RlpA family protein [Acidobacteriota bacterium]|nr:septal ring lytic transglycosylase RlpA family protein [Acidobacteriota bacterium]
MNNPGQVFGNSDAPTMPIMKIRTENFRRGCLLLLVLLSLLGQACQRGRPVTVVMPGQAVTGYASYYAHQFHGRRTANGEVFNMHGMTAAHKTLPFNTVVEVVNLNNNKSVLVRINDRGPFIRGRHIDLSLGAARKIDMVIDGVVPVRMILRENPPDPVTAGLYVIQAGSFKNSDNARKLLESLKALGYDGYMEEYGEFTRVRIGPFTGLAAAETAEKRLGKEGIETFLLRHD